MCFSVFTFVMAVQKEMLSQTFFGSLLVRVAWFLLLMDKQKWGLSFARAQRSGSY